MEPDHSVSTPARIDYYPPEIAHLCALSRKWSYHFPRIGGKVVWCELDSAAPATNDTVKLPPVLPRRQRSNAPVQPTEVMNDPELLRRVLDGLRALRPDEPKE